MPTPNEIIASTEFPKDKIKEMVKKEYTRMHITLSPEQAEEVDKVCAYLANCSRSAYFSALHHLFIIQHPEILGVE